MADNLISESEVCYICYESSEECEIIKLDTCGHTFCEECIAILIFQNTQTNIQCPLDRLIITSISNLTLKKFAEIRLMKFLPTFSNQLFEEIEDKLKTALLIREDVKLIDGILKKYTDSLKQENNTEIYENDTDVSYNDLFSIYDIIRRIELNCFQIEKSFLNIEFINKLDFSDNNEMRTFMNYFNISDFLINMSVIILEIVYDTEVNYAEKFKNAFDSVQFFLQYLKAMSIQIHVNNKNRDILYVSSSLPNETCLFCFNYPTDICARFSKCGHIICMGCADMYLVTGGVCPLEHDTALKVNIIDNPKNFQNTLQKRFEDQKESLLDKIIHNEVEKLISIALELSRKVLIFLKSLKKKFVCCTNKDTNKEYILNFRNRCKKEFDILYLIDMYILYNSYLIMTLNFNKIYKNVNERTENMSDRLSESVYKFSSFTWETFSRLTKLSSMQDVSLLEIWIKEQIERPFDFSL